MLQKEVDNIRVILQDNGYPESIIDRRISNKLAWFQPFPKFGPNKCPVYLKFPWICNISLNLETKPNLLLSIVKEQLNLEFFFQSRKSFDLSTYKNAVSFIQQSMVCYEYVYHCDCRCIGLTFLLLEEKIN